MRYTIYVGVILIIAISLAGGIGIEDVAASHGGDVQPEEVIEVQTFSRQGTEPGRVHVTLTYHIGDDISRIEVSIPENRVQDVTAVDGFQRSSPNTYTSIRGTSNPTLRLVYKVNRTDEDGEYERVGTKDWTLTTPVLTNFRWSSRYPEQVEFQRIPQVDGNGIAGKSLIYFGNYTMYNASASSESIRLVVSEAATPRKSPQNLTASLRDASQFLSIGGYSEEVTAFVVSSPMRRGGRAFGSDFWAHEEALSSPGSALLHEYVHTRQEYRQDESAEWTVEAEANYYTYFVELKRGSIHYSQFRRALINRGTGKSSRSTKTVNEFSDVILNDPSTWRANAQYELGELMLAGLDAKIRSRSAGETTYEAVVRRKNTHDSQVTEADLERYVADAAGTDRKTYFNKYIESQPSEAPSVPRPSMFTAPDTEAELQVNVSDVTLRPGVPRKMRIEVHNTGTGKSLSPTLALNLRMQPLNMSREAIEEKILFYESDAVLVDDRIVLKHIEPGETVEIAIPVRRPEGTQISRRTVNASVRDLSGHQATDTATVRESETTPTPVKETNQTSISNGGDGTPGEIPLNESASDAGEEDDVSVPVMVSTLVFLGAVAGSVVLIGAIGIVGFGRTLNQRVLSVPHIITDRSIRRLAIGLAICVAVGFCAFVFIGLTVA